MIKVSNHLLRKVFRFHYHSQKVIGSLGKHTHPGYRGVTVSVGPVSTSHQEVYESDHQLPVVWIRLCELAPLQADLAMNSRLVIGGSPPNWCWRKLREVFPPKKMGETITWCLKGCYLPCFSSPSNFHRFGRILIKQIPKERRKVDTIPEQKLSM